jgi:cell division protein FtsW (lipid II flippase)
METSTRRILILLSIIAAIGLVTLYSASYIMTYRYPYPPPNYYLVHQIVSLVIGVILMIILSVFDYRKHESYTGIYYILVIFALIAVFFFKWHIRIAQMDIHRFLLGAKFGICQDIHPDIPCIIR